MEFLISLCLPVIPPVSRQAFREYPPILYVYVSPLIRFPSCLQPARHLEKFLFHGKESCYSPHLPRPTDSTHAPHVDIGQECKQCCANRERDERTLFLKRGKPMILQFTLSIYRIFCYTAYFIVVKQHLFLSAPPVSFYRI